MRVVDLPSSYISTMDRNVFGVGQVDPGIRAMGGAVALGGLIGTVFAGVMATAMFRALGKEDKTFWKIVYAVGGVQAVASGIWGLFLTLGGGAVAAGMVGPEQKLPSSSM